jgi:tRNA(Arg) A34 adenosine deaminase TadA
LSSKKTEHELFNRATFLPSPMRHAEILALIEGAHNIRNDDSNSARSHSIEKSCIHDNCLSNNQCKCSRDNRFGDNCPGNYAFEGDRLDDCDMYVTLEPCQMCIGAITLMRLKRVIFGAYSALWLNECARPSPAPRRIIHGESAPAIATHPHSHDNQTSAVEDRGHAYSPGECAPNHHVELIGGILESECADLMHEYFKSRRGFTITNINKAV